MTIPQFPSTLPQVASYDLQPAPQVLASDAPGPRAARRRTRDPGAIAKVSWRMFDDQYKIFMDWWRDDLLRGHRWFTIALPSAVGLKTVTVRFMKHRDVQVAGFKYWLVTADLEILARRIRVEIENVYITSTLYPLLVRDVVASNFDVIAGSLSPSGYATEYGTSLMRVHDGSLADVLTTISIEEDLQQQFVVIGGSLVDTLISIDAGSDSAASAFSVVSGILRDELIVNEVPPDSIASIFAVIAGSLT